MRAVLVATVAAAASASILALPAAGLAQAQDVCAGHPSDPSVVCVRDQAHTVDVCDRHADGHRAYARVVTQESYPAFMSPYYDANDSQAGCTNLHFPSSVVSVAVCVQHEGCSQQKATGVPPPAGAAPPPTPTPTPAPAPAPPPVPPPAPAPAPSGSVEIGIGLGCTPRGRRMNVSLAVHKRPGRAKPRVRRVVFFYRKTRGKRVVARTDRRAPYRRTLPIHLAPGPHRVYARVYYKRAGRPKLARRTVSRRFTVCA